MRELDVRFGSGPGGFVPIVVGRGALGRLAQDLSTGFAARFVVVADSRVATLYGRDFVAALRHRRVVADLLTFKHGEASKTRATKAALEDRLAALAVGRDAVLVALGGGVTGDLAGFVAATWQRGVPVVHAPSTLLAMCDSALGGKTGVDLPGAKNAIGAFHRPEAIYADLALLDTLPDAEWANGFAEVVKTAMVADKRFFGWLERNAGALAARRREAVAHAVAECLRLKGGVVARDERDRGLRAVLNFGHTAAHAIEAAADYKVAHGRAVAAGLAAEGLLATAVHGLVLSDYERMRALVVRLAGGRRLAVPPRSAFLRAVRADKKNRGGTIRCALPSGIGRMRPGPDPTVAVDPEALYEALKVSAR